jgi:hypothetical protein
VMFAEGAIGSDFELCSYGFVGDEVQLQDLNAGFIAKDFLCILQTLAGKRDLKFSTSLAANRSEGFNVGRGGECRRNQNTIQRKEKIANDSAEFHESVEIKSGKERLGDLAIFDDFHGAGSRHQRLLVIDAEKLINRRSIVRHLKRIAVGLATRGIG